MNFAWLRAVGPRSRTESFTAHATPCAVIDKVRATLESYFEFERLGARWRTEILAGVTTFVTMAYIVFVNPSILHEAGGIGPET